MVSSVEQLQYISAGVIFVTGLLFGLAPVVATARQRKHGGRLSSGQALFFSRCNVLAAGVFLSAGFLHLLADSQGAFASFFAATPSAGEKLASYPWWSMCAMAGFVLLFLLQFLVKASHLRGARTRVPGAEDLQGDESDSLTSLRDEEEEEALEGQQETRGLRGGKPPLEAAREEARLRKKMRYLSEEEEDAKMRKVTSFVLAFALDLHALFAGFGLGAESTAGAVESLLGAVLAHKGTAAFALGSSFVASGVPLGATVLMVVLFSLTTPVGVVVAALATNSLQGSARDLSQGILVGLAAGSFLYIASMEMMAVDMHPSKAKDMWLRVLLFLTGLAIMAVVAIWT